MATAKRHNAWGGRGRPGEDDGDRDDGADDGGLGTTGGGGQRSVGGRTIAAIGCFTAASDSSLRRRFYRAIAFSILSLNEIRKVPTKSQRLRETRKIACVRTLRPSDLHLSQGILPRHRVPDRPGPVNTAYVPPPRPAAPALFALRGAVAVHRRYAPRALRPMGEPLLFCFRRPPGRASALTRVAAPLWSFVLLDGSYVELYA